jgi:hypothetical protein
MGWDEIRRPPVEGRPQGQGHTQQPTKNSAAIMEDSKERWRYHQGGESALFGDNIVGSGGNID